MAARKNSSVTTPPAAEPDALPQIDDGAITQLIGSVLDFGLDGLGPIASAERVAFWALTGAPSTEAAVKRVVRRHVAGAGVGGFATGVGGFVTMVVAVPVNVVEFYIQAARMVGAIAHLRGYDIKDATVRTAILLTMIGANATEVLRAAGLPLSSSVGALATRRLPSAAAMVVNKAIAFRLVKMVGERALVRAGRAVPVLGGGVGALFDGAMLHRIGEAARREFPPVVRPVERDWGVR